ncbi:hypothetical protein O0I10_001383 [Lichtheimia ornata]|uniref:Uncharacterized protein n=1 Tax=Lichtheimia ornata TaxID=688661 RepID=A0AAD7Y3N3_9FUNG|nr:uncharacterized protein O0I10_001383 [Lichtheimia ornata]KAJ8663206.1 hypothetical protein O0I10_001383 [Lichtheimia ornata]
MDNRSILNSYESTEHALMDSFKAAAVKVTNLYKDALAQNRRGYAAGYQQAFQDLFEFTRTHAHGSTHIAVEDLLEFAQRKDEQLMAELGSDGVLDGSNPPSTSTTTTTAAAAAATTTTNNTSTHTTTTHNHLSTPTPDQKHQDAMVDKSIFQIDPNTQFTFTPPTLSPRVPYGSMMASPWMVHPHQQQQQHQENMGDTLKRRHVGNELSFMGRTLSNMDVDSTEPSMKRNKSK